MDLLKHIKTKKNFERILITQRILYKLSEERLKKHFASLHKKYSELKKNNIVYRCMQI